MATIPPVNFGKDDPQEVNGKSPMDDSSGNMEDPPLKNIVKTRPEYDIATFPKIVGPQPPRKVKLANYAYLKAVEQMKQLRKDKENNPIQKNRRRRQMEKQTKETTNATNEEEEEAAA